MSTLEPEQWRLRALNVLSTFLSGFAVLWGLLFLFRPQYEGAFPYLLCALAGLIPAAIRPLGYLIRGTLLVFGLSAVVLLGSWTGGATPGAVMGGLLAIMTAGFLFGIRQAVLCWLVSCALWGTGLYLFEHYPIDGGVSFLDPSQGANFWRMLASYVAFSSILALGVTAVVNQLGASLREAQQAQAGAEQAQTEREQALRQMIEAQKFQVLAQMSGGVAHDVNNSLQVLTGYCELLALRGYSAEKAAEIAREMNEVCQDTSKLVGQLLTLGKQVVLDRHVVDLGGEISRTARSIKRLLPANVKLVLDCPGGTNVSVDSMQLKQALLNLAINAGHAMPNGGVLELSIEDGLDGHAALVVRDTGIGMKEATLADIFKPFFTTKGEGGSGLGLSTVKAITEQHGGRLEVESEWGKGTTFRLVLPICSSGADTKSGPLPSEFTLKGIHVLVVDDDQRVLSAVSRMLHVAGAEVTTADSVDRGIVAIEQAKDPHHVVCVDAVMPGRSTKDLLDCYRSLNVKGAIIICSGSVESELVRRGIQDRTYYHVAKPFTSEALIRKVRQATRAATEAAPPSASASHGTLSAHSS